jgi:REP element-mobilizing transposase RayT
MITMIKNFFFFTATVFCWKHILKPDKYKDVLIESFKFLVNTKRVRIFAFVIMPNHYHTVWRINKSLEKSDFQRVSLKFTGQTILRDLKFNHREIHNSMYVGACGNKLRVSTTKMYFSIKLYQVTV